MQVMNSHFLQILSCDLTGYQDPAWHQNRYLKRYNTQDTEERGNGRRTAKQEEETQVGALRTRTPQLPVAHGLKTDPRRNARRKVVSVLQDDTSRFVTGYGISDEAATENTLAVLDKLKWRTETVTLPATTENALAVLDKAMGDHGRPASIMTDHGSRFYANKRDQNGDAGGRFEMRLAGLGICNAGRRKPSPDKRQAGAPARRDTVQTAPVRGDNDGKERSHGPVHAVVQYDRPHMSLDWDNQETPVQASARKMPPKGETVLGGETGEEHHAE